MGTPVPRLGTQSEVFLSRHWEGQTFPRLSRAHMDSQASPQHRRFSPQLDDPVTHQFPFITPVSRRHFRGALIVTPQWQGEAICNPAWTQRGTRLSLGSETLLE